MPLFFAKDSTPIWPILITYTEMEDTTMQHLQMNRIPTSRKTSMRRIHVPQQLDEDLCTLAGLRGGCSRYDLDLLMEALDSEQARGDVYPLVIQLIRMWAAEEPAGLSGYVVDDCRKICDVMGWTPTRENCA